MKITLTWTPTGAVQSSSYVLVDSPDPIPMTNFKINPSRSIQEAMFFRATARQFYDRGNRKNEITFDTTRLFADQVSAETFVLMHETMFPGQFLATFVAGRSGAGTTATRYLINAVVESTGISMTGCTTKQSYKISGGVMSLTPK